MRAGFLSLALIIVVFAGAPGDLAPVTRIASAQSSPPRNQTQPQEGLSPEKKKALSKIGPEDIFPPERENNTNPAPVRQPPRSPRPTAAFPPSAPPRLPATSVPVPSATPPQPAVEAPSPTMPAAALDSGGIQQPPLGQEVPSIPAITRWTAPFLVLIALALIVSAALIFTLTKLWERIRESSSG